MGTVFESGHYSRRDSFLDFTVHTGRGQCHPTLNGLLGKGFLNNIMFLASSFFNCRKKLGPILSVISYKEHALAAKYGLRFMR